MSNLSPSSITLDKGLDLQSPKVVAPPGSILDSLNYEQVDFIGQKRIDGYTRYDGSPLSAIDDFLLVDNPTTTQYPPYTVVFSDSQPCGVVVGNVAGASAIAVFDYNYVPEGSTWGVKAGLTPVEHYDYVLQFNQYLRDNVESLPGPIIGLHWFRDRLYAVADIASYTPADGRIDTANRASLFESRSVKQVLEEDGPSGPYDFGWKFVHQGWWVEFEKGRVLFGDLTAKNQNRSGVGVQGPTSTAGTSGAPFILSQRISITNWPAQVNGWKSSATPTSFLLDPGDVAQVGGDFAYADAFVSWDGETGAVTAPGANGVGLVEYAANSSVEVDV